MRLSEGIIHIAIRRYLMSQGWQLIAGQYPGGSDDELPILNVFDPTLATDNSPDPRRHSLGKQVPDLIAYKNGILLVVEAKASYDVGDRDKLIELLTTRRPHLLSTLAKFALERQIPHILPVEGLSIIPALAFSASARVLERDRGFVYLKVEGVDSVTLEGPF